jgi:endonuclease-3
MATMKSSVRTAKKTNAKNSKKGLTAPRKDPRKSEASLSPAKQSSKKKPKLFKGTELKAHAAEIEKRLLAEYPTAHCELDYETPLQLVVATILSAQCTDKRVNMVTPALFAKYPTVHALAAAKIEDIEELVKSTGFFRSKAKSILGMANKLVEKHGGEVPRTIEELVVLPGVGRKTANVVLGNAFGINVGIVVDTHVARLSARFGITRETDPVKIEQALIPLFPQPGWTMLSHLMIWHGRRTCDARKPKCGECVLRDICPSAP